MKTIKAKEIDRKFDEGGDISKYLDLSKARSPEQEQKRAKTGKYGQNLFTIKLLNVMKQKSNETV